MNPNSFRSNDEFNVDDEIAKLWASLGEEVEKINSSIPLSQDRTQPTVKKNNSEKGRFNPITINQNAPEIAQENGPEIPNFSAVSRKKTGNADGENSRRAKLPPTIGESSPGVSLGNGPEIPNLSHRNNSASETARPSYEIPQVFGEQDASPLVPKMPKKQPDVVRQKSQFLPRAEASPRAEIITENELKQIATRTTETLQNTRALRKKLTGIVGENVERIKESSTARFENARNNLNERCQIYAQKARNNKNEMLSVGKKGIAVLLSALTIGSTAAALAHQKRSKHATSAMTTAGEEYEKIHDQEIEGARGGKAEIREYVDAETGKSQVEILLNNPISIERPESQNEENVIFEDDVTESFEIGTKANEETKASSGEKSTVETLTESSDIIEKSTEAVVEELSTESGVDHETKNGSGIKNDMELSINLTEQMQDELEFVRKIFVEHKALYQKIADRIEQDTGISLPKEAICAIHYRESRCDFDAYLQNGEKLGQVTKLVPKGIYFDNFFDSAVSAIKDQLKAYQDYNEIDLHSMSGLCKFTNRYNGTGSQKYYGLPSSYVYTGTSKYQGGMYVADGSFSASTNDTRMGTYPIIAKLANLA